MIKRMTRYLTILMSLYALMFTATQAVGASNETGVPDKFRLAQNYPNPFNPSTRIDFDLAEVSFVTLRVYNIIGQEIRALVNEQFPGGRYTIEWDGRDNQGNPVASGMYFYRIVASDLSVDSANREPFIQTRKMILVR